MLLILLYPTDTARDSGKKIEEIRAAYERQFQQESVLRAVLRRYLPKNVAIGKGFVVSDEETSTQIDILIYDTNAPILFQDGDLVLIRPDAVRAAVEVKTSIRRSDLDGA